MAKHYEKLDSKSRELACEAAMTAAAEIINEVCGTEGSKVVAITDKGAKLSFAVPPDVMDKINRNPKITLEEATETLYRLPWSREWSAGISRMVYSPERWEAMPAKEREEIQKRLIKEKLAPALLA
ncbi:unnamed protein product [marine sediment metagenome]|uniref:Uncharacterized protein n=1 Tax=marine sediment metagenome TaxID=412755 RepID=X1P0H1_9ZZZZ